MPSGDRVMPSAGAWTPFHQAEALTTRLANILEEYPPGVSTLREFVQNADDAGASRMMLCLDLRDGAASKESGALPTKALDAYAGPALLVYNDAEFSERDFDSITSIGRSRKRADSTTIGKYGLVSNMYFPCCTSHLDPMLSRPYFPCCRASMSPTISPTFQPSSPAIRSCSSILTAARFPATASSACEPALPTDSAVTATAT